MKKIPLLSLFLGVFALALVSCASSGSTKSVEKAAAKTSCPDDLFIDAKGYGADRDEARENSRSAIGKSIISEVESYENTENSKREDSEGRLIVSSSYSAKNIIKSSFKLHGFKEMKTPRQLEDSTYEYHGYVCNYDVAKPYWDSLNLHKEALEALKNQNLNKTTCDKAKEIRMNMLGFQTILDFLKQTDKNLKKEYEEIYAEILNDCSLEASKKLHWKPEKQTAYSNITFSKLSERIKIEESSCPKKSRDFLLVFREEEKCGSNSLEIECSLKPFLAIQSCDGKTYSVLTTKETISGSNGYSKGKAKENLIENLSRANFFKEWEKEIKEVIPECSK